MTHIVVAESKAYTPSSELRHTTRKARKTERLVRNKGPYRKQDGKHKRYETHSEGKLEAFKQLRGWYKRLAKRIETEILRAELEAAMQ